jgi:circadian clock protein KaiC
MSDAHAGSGNDGLDEVLRGGFPRGQIYLLRGPSGAGKTTLSLQFLIEGARRDESCLYIGTSETEDEIRAVAASHGWSLAGVRSHHHVAEGGDEQTMLHPAETDLPRVIESLLAVVDDVSPTRLVIDSLAEIRLMSRDEFWYRRQLTLLKQHFADRRCTVLLVEVPGPDQSTLDSLVSGVVELEQQVSSYGPDRGRLHVAKLRGQAYATGYHDYRICTGGVRVFPRLAASEHRQRFPFERVATGSPALDTMLDGGLVRGTSTLLLGPSGTGKSVVATQLAVAAARRGERVATFVFDERVQTLFQRAESLGMSLEPHVERGTIQVRQIDPAELTAGEFSRSARTCVEQDEVRMLVVDSLNGYAYAMPDDRMLNVHLHELSSYLSQRRVNAVFTMTQHGLLMGEIEQPFDVSYLADTVLLFRHFEYGGQLRKAFSVYKSRSSRHEGTIRELRFSAKGLWASEPLTRFRGVLAGTPALAHDDDAHVSTDPGSPDR